LENIPEDSFLLKYENKNKEFIFFKTKTDSCPYIILPESYEEYLKSLGKKTRFNLNYYRRLLFRNFKTEFKVVQEKKELSNTLSKFFELHKKRWLKKGLPGMLYNKKRKEFHKEISNDLLEKNILRLYTLSLDGEIVGVLYGFLYSKKFYYYLSGFDPKFYKYSIGTVLTSYAIEKSIEEKAEIFDFLRGDEEYKYRFGCKNKFNYNLYIAKKEIKSLILFKKNKIQNKFENILKKAIR
jgi:CelD/BcsL family acetyltransferase involved in cellulose biosynthesis